jgi:hypothetical protein
MKWIFIDEDHSNYRGKLLDLCVSLITRLICAQQNQGARRFTSFCPHSPISDFYAYRSLANLLR